MAEDLPGPGSVFLHVDWSFKAPVRPGDEITAEVEVLEARDDKPVAKLRTTITNQDGRSCSTAPRSSGPSPSEHDGRRAPGPRRGPVPDHSGLAAKRVAVGGAGGIAVAALVLSLGASWSVAALCASDVAALVFLVWVWVDGGRRRRGCTARIARAEDASHAAAEAILVAAGAGSLLAVAFTLAQAGNAGAGARPADRARHR